MGSSHVGRAAPVSASFYSAILQSGTRDMSDLRLMPEQRSKLLDPTPLAQTEHGKKGPGLRFDSRDLEEGKDEGPWSVFAPATAKKMAVEGRRVRIFLGKLVVAWFWGEPRSPATTQTCFQCAWAPRVSGLQRRGDDASWQGPNLDGPRVT